MTVDTHLSAKPNIVKLAHNVCEKQLLLDPETLQYAAAALKPGKQTTHKFKVQFSKQKKILTSSQVPQAFLPADTPVSKFSGELVNRAGQAAGTP